jgi:hypothetical protein
VLTTEAKASELIDEEEIKIEFNNESDSKIEGNHALER